MLGMEMMLKNMLESMGVDIESLTREGVEAYKRFTAMAEHMAMMQRAIYELQKSNADKLDAIMAHLDIELSRESVSNDEEIRQLTIGGDSDGTGEREPDGFQ